jgi:alkylation response protein AidB-like acyl-CoA dehydrogenase
MVQPVRSLFEEFVRTDAKDLPAPGAGETWRRFEVLARWASFNLSVGRLSEGHADALAILAEAGLEVKDSTASYGVWAAKSRLGGTSAERVPGGWRLEGCKQFCSGNGIIDRALVTADTEDGVRLFDVVLEESVIGIHPDSWSAVGMADSASETLEFGGPVLSEVRVVGPVDFYTRRPGFWFGSSGVAACWYGGAVGLVNNLVASLSAEPNEHVLADLGVAASSLEAMRAVLKETADSIDLDAIDADGQGHYRALVTRQVVHDLATEVLARVATAGGARPLCHDIDQARRAADLYVYLAQHHGGVDAAELGRLVRSRPPWN